MELFTIIALAVIVVVLAIAATYFACKYVIRDHEYDRMRTAYEGMVKERNAYFKEIKAKDRLIDVMSTLITIWERHYSKLDKECAALQDACMEQMAISANLAEDYLDLADNAHEVACELGRAQSALAAIVAIIEDEECYICDCTHLDCPTHHA